MNNTKVNVYVILSHNFQVISQLFNSGSNPEFISRQNSIYTTSCLSAHVTNEHHQENNACQFAQELRMPIAKKEQQLQIHFNTVINTVDFINT